VLAGVEELAGVGVVEGAGASAEALARFDEVGAEAAGREAGRGGEAGEAGADDEDAISHAKKVSASAVGRLGIGEFALPSKQLCFRKW